MSDNIRVLENHKSEAEKAHDERVQAVVDELRALGESGDLAELAFVGLTKDGEMTCRFFHGTPMLLGAIRILERDLVESIVEEHSDDAG